MGRDRREQQLNKDSFCGWEWAAAVNLPVSFGIKVCMSWMASLSQLRVKQRSGSCSGESGNQTHMQVNRRLRVTRVNFCGNPKIHGSDPRGQWDGIWHGSDTSNKSAFIFQINKRAWRTRRGGRKRRSHQRASLPASALCVCLKWWSASSLQSAKRKHNHLKFLSQHRPSL